MLKIFTAFVRKEFFHILRDRRTLLILLGMPVALVLLFGYVVTNEFKDASVIVLDNAHDELSTKFRRQLEASGHFKVRADVRSHDEIESYFKSGDAKLAIVLPPNFGSDFYQKENTQILLVADGSEPNYAVTLISYASQIIQDFQLNQVRLLHQIPYRIRVESKMVYNPQLMSAYTFVPGVIALILLIISAMMTSLTIAREVELGTMDLLLVSPLPPLLILLGKVVPYALLSFLSMLLVLVLGHFVFKVPIIGSLALLLSACFLYLIVSLALGVLISTRAETQQAAMMSSLFSLLMPTMLLSGFIFPVSGMPWLLRTLSKIIPATYFIEVLKGIMLKGAGLNFIWKPLGILGGMAVLLLVLALANFKIRKK